MKKIFFFFLVLAFLIACYVPMVQDFSLSYFFSSGEFSLFSSDNDLLESQSWQSVVSVGQEWIASCVVEDASQSNFSAFDIRGEMVTVPLSEKDNLKKMKDLLNFKLVFSEVLEGVGTCEYGYTPKISSYVTIDGEKINLQIVSRSASYVVGWPVILGSY